MRTKKRIYKVFGNCAPPAICTTKDDVRKMVTKTQLHHEVVRGCKCSVVIETYEIVDLRVVMRGAEF